MTTADKNGMISFSFSRGRNLWPILFNGFALLHDRIRKIGYQTTALVLLCYSLTHLFSLKNSNMYAHKSIKILKATSISNRKYWLKPFESVLCVIGLEITTTISWFRINQPAKNFPAFKDRTYRKGKFLKICTHFFMLLSNVKINW